jgi:hypothetical protein
MSYPLTISVFDSFECDSHVHVNNDDVLLLFFVIDLKRGQSQTPDKPHKAPV